MKRGKRGEGRGGGEAAPILIVFCEENCRSFLHVKFEFPMHVLVCFVILPFLGVNVEDKQ